MRANLIIKILVPLWLIAASLGGVNKAEADYLLIENFEALDLGDIDGQNGWNASSLGGDVVTLPSEGDNQSLKLIVNSGVLYKPLTIANGEKRMLFLRFRYEGQHNYSFGMSHLSSPDEYDDFGPELRKSAALDNFKIHDGHTYADLTTLLPATWYNLWIYIDNDLGNSQVWLHDRDGEAPIATDLLDAEGQTVFDFRTDLNQDLVTFYLKAADGGSGNDPLWIDDIYLENTPTLNLTNPIPEPASAVLVIMGLAFAIHPRRG